MSLHRYQQPHHALAFPAKPISLHATNLTGSLDASVNSGCLGSNRVDCTMLASQSCSNAWTGCRTVWAMAPVTTSFRMMLPTSRVTSKSKRRMAPIPRHSSSVVTNWSSPRKLEMHSTSTVSSNFEHHHCCTCFEATYQSSYT